MDELSRSILKDFAKVTNDSGKTKETPKYARGTITGKGEAKYVQLDGSTVATPISEVVDAQEGDRVLVSIENHRAVILGNFSVSPSGRKEQEALDKAEDAQNGVNNAIEIGNAASEAAKEASKKAEDALTAASEVNAIAEEAKQAASDAQLAADNASKQASEAKDAASKSEASSNEAKDAAGAAQAAVAGATEEINKVKEDVGNVRNEIQQGLDQVGKDQAAIVEKIETEYTKKTETTEVEVRLSTEISKKVGELKTTISQEYYGKSEISEITGKLQSQITQNSNGLTSVASKMEHLQADTSAAQDLIDQALGQAFDAQNAAKAAQDYANQALATANSAKEASDLANQKAAEAATKAEEARKVVEQADADLAAARTKLKEAQENLQSIIDKGGTEEEIAAAEKVVEAAQLAVNEALANVAEAEYAATMAQKAAEAAQIEADEALAYATNAKKKADSAQIVADNALEAARKAQEEAAALTNRISQAETKINQNAEAIELKASKDDIINSINELEIGGRNLIQNSFIRTELNPDGTTEEYICSTWASTFISASKLLNVLEPNKEYTMSFTAELTKRTTVPTLYSHTVGFLLYSGSSTDAEKDISIQTTKLKNVGDKEELSVTFTAPPNINNGKYILLIYTNRYTTNGGNPVGFDTVKFTKIKLEKGNKATDWTPAPEDSNFDNLIIGARNFLLDSKEGYKFTNNETINTATMSGTKVTSKATGKISVYLKTENKLSITPNDIKNSGENYSYSLDVKITGSFKGANTRMDFRDVASAANGKALDINILIPDDIPKNKWVRLSGTAKANEAKPDPAWGGLLAFGAQDSTVGSTFEYRLVKFERGNKATDWTPAPEDIDADIDAIDSNLKNNYYKKTETDAAIKVAADNIKLEVKETITETVTTEIDKVEIGARNLVINSPNKVISPSGFTATNNTVFNDTTNKTGKRNDITITGEDTTTTNRLIYYPKFAGITVEAGEIYTLSLYIKASRSISITAVSMNEASVTYWNQLKQVTTEYQKLIVTVKINSSLSANRNNNFHIFISEKTFPFTISIHSLKIEKGNKATDWTPAPEDIESDISNNVNSIRANNMILNGLGSLKNNLNFSGLTFDGTQVYKGSPSFKYTGTNKEITLGDELIQIDPNKQYKFNINVRGASAQKLYLGFDEYDIDGKYIRSTTQMGFKNSTTTLAKDLKPGDTIVYLTSAAGWNVSSTSPIHQLGLIFWNYKDSTGYQYPEGVYSQNYILDAYLYSGVDKSNNTITLKKAWTGATYPAGTKVSQSSLNGHKYFGYVNKDLSTEWDNVEFILGSNEHIPYGFLSTTINPATKYIRFVILANYGSNTAATSYYNSISLCDATNEFDYNHKFDGIDQNFQEVITDYTSLIDQTKDSISLEVSEKYTTKTETDTKISEVSSKLEQTANGIDIKFKNYEEQVNNAVDGIQNEVNKRESMIRFVDGKIILGVKGNEITLVQKNDRISFMQNDTVEVAYFSNSKLYVKDAEFIVSLQVGGFAFVPRSNGSLDFKKVK